MGLPVVTLAGTSMMSRWSSSMLHALRLDGLVARSPEQYVTLALRLAGDASFRRRLRTDLRDLILRSPLCSGQLRARQIERAYRAMWRRWCRAPAS
jgi:predicted O-linked N-acetylglucosamine transferase (SPINDLY family)